MLSPAAALFVSRILTKAAGGSKAWVLRQKTALHFTLASHTSSQAHPPAAISSHPFVSAGDAFMRFPVLVKAAALGGVMLGLLAALGAVSDVVAEREGRLREAQRNVAESFASAQALLGPVMQRVCTESWETQQGEGKDRKMLTETRDVTLRAAPGKLTIESDVAIEPRHRGIFVVNTFITTAVLRATWADLAALKPPPLRQPNVRLQCEAPTVLVAVRDARGIRSVKLDVGGSPVAVAPGAGAGAQAQGFHAALPDWSPESASARPGPLQVNVQLVLAGTESLAIAPVADDTKVAMRSNWPHPSFGGRFLPSTREIGDMGFTADWQVSALASAAQRQWLDGAATCPIDHGEVSEPAAAAAASTPCIEAFSVAFVDPVSAYALSDRATKYGLLFIVLTFAAVALLEATRRLRVHAMQYLLVGCALVIFFLLLVSLTEHLAFGWSYLIAATACTLLLGHYARHVLGGLRAGAGFAASIAGLYGVLYLLLQLEQTALLLGSLLLFAALAAVMTATRKLDWFALFSTMRSSPTLNRSPAP
jgi:inner membrane protein